jgi:hypothetical protein
MSEYEKELERNIELLQEKLQTALERQERDSKAINGTLYDVIALLIRLTECVGKLKRIDEDDSDGVEKTLSYQKNKKSLEKELLSTRDAIHDRIINLLDRFKE